MGDIYWVMQSLIYAPPRTKSGKISASGPIDKMMLVHAFGEPIFKFGSDPSNPMQWADEAELLEWMEREGWYASEADALVVQLRRSTHSYEDPPIKTDRTPH